MRIIFLVTVLFLVGCNNEAGNQKLNNKKSESDSGEYKTKPVENHGLKVILLENGFDQDTVRISTHNSVLFEGVTTTDPRIGSAEAIEVELPPSLKVLDYKMNNWSKKIELENSTFLHINKIANDSIEVVYTDRFGGYY